MTKRTRPMPPIEEIEAGDAFIQTLLSRADAFDGGAPLWHGWAIMDGFLAGIAYERKRRLRAGAARHGTR